MAGCDYDCFRRLQKSGDAEFVGYALQPFLNGCEAGFNDAHALAVIVAKALQFIDATVEVLNAPAADSE